MNYKAMLLAALLVPCTIFSNETVDTRIQQLKKDLYAKELELSDLSKIIEEKQGWIDLIRNNQREFAHQIFSGSDVQENEALRTVVSSFQQELNRVCDSKKDLQQFLLKKLLDNNPGSFCEIERMKSWCIRYYVEYNFLSKLTKRYEECVQEMLAIEIELEELQK
jgi:hypothetical protein